MNNYIRQKKNIENQGWKPYQSIGNKVYFNKSDINGLVISVDKVTGKATVESGCPQYFAKKHTPNLL